jgi:hypothetical protein
MTIVLESGSLNLLEPSACDRSFAEIALLIPHLNILDFVLLQYVFIEM